MQKIGSLLFSTILCYSCVSEAEIDLPMVEPLVALQGIIHPESVIQISLTRSVPLQAEDQNFAIINDADVSVLEDGQDLGPLIFKDSLYSLDYYPKPGREYTVEARIRDLTLRATDVVPLDVLASACFVEQDDYIFSDIYVRARIEDQTTEENVYWLDVVATNYERFTCDFIPDDPTTHHCFGYDSSTLVSKTEYPLISYSTLPDKFNALVDNTAKGITEYDFYMRIEDRSVSNQAIMLDFTGNSPLFRSSVISQPADGQALVLTITSASSHYDRYLKSSFLYYLNFESFDNPSPFAEPIRVYSNVENGTGIFAAYNSTSIHIEGNPCE